MLRGRTDRSRPRPRGSAHGAPVTPIAEARLTTRPPRPDEPASPLTARPRSWWTDIRLVTRRTASDYIDDHCSQLAAGISYYVVFSIVPLAILLAGVGGLLLQHDGLRADVIDALIDALPLAESEDRSQFEDAFDTLSSGFSVAVLVGFIGLLWSATGMMGAVRFALNKAWDTDYRRPLVTGKIVDVLMVLGIGVLLGASVAATVFFQIARRLSSNRSEWLSPFGEGATYGLEITAVLVSLSLSFVTFLVVFVFVPSVRTRFRYVWPGALLSAVLFELLQNGFALYLRYFGNFDAIYGPLGAAVAFLFFVYLSANVVLLGAEMAAEWPRVTHGWYDHEQREPQPSSRKDGLRAFFVGLVHRDEPPPDHIPDDSNLRSAAHPSHPPRA